MHWNYNAKQYDPSKVGGYELIPEGDYRCRIKAATEAQTKREPVRDMIVLEVEISGYSRSLKYYLVLDGTSEEATQRTNQTLGTVFACFGIQPGNFNLAAWAGKSGGCHIAHEDYTGSDGKEHTSAKIGWFLLHEQCSGLPAWGIKPAKPKTPMETIAEAPKIQVADYFASIGATAPQPQPQQADVPWETAAEQGDLPWAT